METSLLRGFRYWFLSLQLEMVLHPFSFSFFLFFLVMFLHNTPSYPTLKKKQKKTKKKEERKKEIREVSNNTKGVDKVDSMSQVIVNQVVYDQLELGSRKYSFIFVCLVNMQTSKAQTQT